MNINLETAFKMSLHIINQPLAAGWPVLFKRPITNLVIILDIFIVFPFRHTPTCSWTHVFTSQTWHFSSFRPFITFLKSDVIFPFSFYWGPYWSGGIAGNTCTLQSPLSPVPGKRRTAGEQKPFGPFSTVPQKTTTSIKWKLVLFNFSSASPSLFFQYP